MGVGYYKNVTQWSKGEYPDASQTQDDIAIINDKLGGSADTHGQAASPVSLYVDSSGHFSATNREIDPDSIIAENKDSIQVGDSDWFQFSAGAGPAELYATPAWDAFTRSTRRGANLDIGMRLYDSTGALIATSNSNSETSASIQIDLAEGIHTLEIFGAAGPYASDYASQGHFYLQGNIVPSTPDTTPPDPNPMGFAQAPNAISDTQIAMQATVATDDSGTMVSYLFSCTQNTAQCTSSGWQNDVNYIATNLTPLTPYCFSVQAKDISGNTTLASQSVCATTLATQPKAEPPAAPSNLSAVDGQNATALLSWQDNSTNEQTFEVQRESQHKSGRWQAPQIVALLSADSADYSDVSDTGTFRYRVRANNDVASSSWTSWVTVTVTNTNSGGPDKPCKGRKCNN
ncbi:hypothetical protein [Pseudoalteromonas sp. S16_S37]|uniref:hypothetical protein n=1 Tax=Pseudoalteromonas sp. S16_S37 TaxID=2720228 RepID=UPI0016802172|nr:hypothetical protein [Pseudoalteromonas sp. S16_S37]MBD1581105.1 hypothetical protein [Pseudoalteromonas sp. S16_S37]